MLVLAVDIAVLVVPGNIRVEDGLIVSDVVQARGPELDVVHVAIVEEADLRVLVLLHVILVLRANTTLIPGLHAVLVLQGDTLAEGGDIVIVVLLVLLLTVHVQVVSTADLELIR
jgi:hypothetical protein